MPKIDKNDLENISILKKELKLKGITTVKIKKGNYEIELSSSSNSIIKNIPTSLTDENKSSDQIENKTLNLKNENIVKSPMVGVAYLSSDPSASPYVKEGQHVKQGDILLLIEAMKTFNEIKAPKSGIIKKIEILNSQPVEFGDALIVLE